jgi:hypothetical protein
MTLARIDLTTGRVEPPFFRQPKWLGFAVSPDGAQVAVLMYTDSIGLVDTATGQSNWMTVTPPLGGQLQDVTFTPDGRTLIISGMEFNGAYGLVAVRLDGRAAMLYSAPTTWISDPRVSPDGRTLAFRGRAYDSDVWLLEPRDE